MLAELEGILEVTRPADASSQVEQLLSRSRRHDHAQALVGLQPSPRIDVAQGDEVEHVIGVHVAHDDRVELIGVVPAQELRNDAGTDVHEHARAARLDQVAGAGLSGVRTRG